MMPKVRTNVYISKELRDLAKARGVCLSTALESALVEQLDDVIEDTRSVIIKKREELKALEAYDLNSSRAIIELRAIRERAGWRFRPERKTPTPMFEGWWRPARTRMEYPSHYSCTAQQVWDKLREASK